MRHIVYFVCFLAAIVLYLFTRTEAALFLMSASVLFPVAALVLAELSAGKVSVSLRIPASLRKGETTQCTLYIEARTMIPIACIELTLRIHNTLTGQTKAIPLAFSTAPHEKRDIRLAFTGEQCGQYRFTCTEMRIFDFLGLRGIRKDAGISEKRTVPPELFGLRVELMNTESPPGGSETFSMPWKGQDMTEPFQIREYAEGDSLKLIHWKLTQKLDRYMVIDPSLELEASLLMLWDGAPLPAGTSPQIPDTLAEAFVSICIALVENNIPYSVAWENGETGEVVLKEVSIMDDVYDVVPGILCANGERGASVIPELVQKLDGKNHPATAYFSYQAPKEPLLSGTITAFLCTSADELIANDEEIGTRFTPTNYRTVLRDIRI